jgi:hypothetical protein
MTGEDLELAAAAGAALDLDAEHALQALRPVHRHLSRRRLANRGTTSRSGAAPWTRTLRASDCPEAVIGIWARGHIAATRPEAETPPIRIVIGVSRVQKRLRLSDAKEHFRILALNGGTQQFSRIVFIGYGRFIV